MYAGVAREACTPSPSLVMPDRKAVDFELLEGQGGILADCVLGNLVC